MVFYRVTLLIRIIGSYCAWWVESSTKVA